MCLFSSSVSSTMAFEDDGSTLPRLEHEKSVVASSRGEVSSYSLLRQREVRGYCVRRVDWVVLFPIV